MVTGHVSAIAATRDKEREGHLLESPLPTGLLLPVCVAHADMGLLNTSQLLALLPASSCPPLRHSIA